MKEKLKLRNSLIYFVVGAILLGEVGALYWNSGYVKGLNQTADDYKTAAVTEMNMNTIASGDIYDRNGSLLVETEEAKGESVYADDYAYSQVIGYTGPTKLILGNQVSDAQKDYRLMKYYREQLYQPANIDGTKGNNLTLTIDHGLQMAVKEALLKEMTLEDKGSAVVLNAKTGEILAMVSFPAFNANELDESIVWMAEADASKEIYYPITHKDGDCPGSIFKIVTMVALLDNGYEDFTVKDSSYSLGDAKIVNSYASSGDEIDCYEAFVRSSNVFFSKAALEIGGNALSETAKKFMIGEELELDIGTISSNWDVDSNDLIEVAYTGFGQGKTLCSTLTAAMMVQAIAGDGVMMKPYMVKSISNAEGKILYEGQSEVLSQVTSKETADKVEKAMNAAGEEYGYTVLAKTGTGQNGDAENTNNAWFASYSQTDDGEPEYVVVVNQCKTDKHGIDVADTAAAIYDYLHSHNQL